MTAQGVVEAGVPAALQYGGWAVAVVLLPAFAVLWARLTKVEDARVAEAAARAELERRLDELERRAR